MEINGTFEIEQQGDTIVVSPLTDLGELEYHCIERDGNTVLSKLADAQARNVVVDFSKTNYYGSTALGFFIRLWKRARLQDGHMAFCCVSPTEREILKITHIDTLWSVCDSREEALEAVHRQS